MSIIINIDVMLAKRKMSVTELAERVGITMANISVLKNGKAKAIRLSTLEGICRALECQPGDILEYKKVAADGKTPSRQAVAERLARQGGIRRRA
jgi:putative transcriptional regulator